eukprot:6400274-Pyramimonas_sp.AAC.1
MRPHHPPEAKRRAESSTSLRHLATREASHLKPQAARVMTPVTASHRCCKPFNPRPYTPALFPPPVPPARLDQTNNTSPASLRFTALHSACV